jgi:replicative DNA helicase Mcm
MVKDAAPQLIERFIDAAILGDGWRQGTFRTYATVSKTLAGDMQELFLKIGRSGNVAMRDGKPFHIRDHSGVSSPQYHVSETTTPAAVLRRSDNTSLISRVRYDGMVYCVSVPNGTLIARRNGKAAIVGNCEAMNAAAAYLLGVQRLRELPVEGGTARAAGAPIAKRNRMADYSAMLNR